MPSQKPLLFVAITVAFAACSESASIRVAADRGRYLVQTMGCADCHTPRGPDAKPIPGFELAGHPADAPLPRWTADLLEKHGIATIAATGTAFAGPFGLSVAPNLTPDPETGIAALTAEALVTSWKTGRHWSFERQVMPPMPVESYRSLDEADIRSIHAYLMSLTPVRNAAPPSVPAAGQD